MQTFEWIVVLTVLGVGIIAGVAAVRNTIINEFSEVAGEIGAVEVSRCLEGSSPCPLPMSSAAVESPWWVSSSGQTIQSPEN
jgi:hypothetical protein